MTGLSPSPDGNIPTHDRVVSVTCRLHSDTWQGCLRHLPVTFRHMTGLSPSPASNIPNIQLLFNTQSIIIDALSNGVSIRKSPVSSCFVNTTVSINVASHSLCNRNKTQFHRFTSNYRRWQHYYTRLTLHMPHYVQLQ